MKPILAKELRKQKEIRKQIGKFDPVIDDFISIQCELAFMQCDNTVKLPVRRLFSCGIDVHYLIHHVQMRGFNASLQCEDRPCGECWVEITLPLGGE